MTTARQHIVTAQAELAAALALLPPDPPPGPPASPWDAFNDARTAKVDPNNATLAAAFQKYAVAANGGPYFTSAVARATATTADPRYAVTVTGESVPPLTAYIPEGTLPGITADRSLYVVQPDRSVADFSGAVYNATSKRIASTAGAALVPAGALNETGPGSANAAAFPYAAGPITPEDLARFAADPSYGHALVFSCPNLGPAPNRVPARPGSAGYPTGTGIVLGTRLALPPATPIDPSASILARFTTACLIGWGMFCRDINPAPSGTLSIIGTAEVNTPAGNTAAWKAAGVTLDVLTSSKVPYACKLAAGVPWNLLRVLVPPVVT